MLDTNGAPRSRAERRITAREHDVLELVANGYSTAEIARELWITEDTVRTHIKRMMVGWRLELAHTPSRSRFARVSGRSPKRADGGDDVR